MASLRMMSFKIFADVLMAMFAISYLDGIWMAFGDGKVAGKGSKVEYEGVE